MLERLAETSHDEDEATPTFENAVYYYIREPCSVQVTLVYQRRVDKQEVVTNSTQQQNSLLSHAKLTTGKENKVTLTVISG